MATSKLVSDETLDSVKKGFLEKHKQNIEKNEYDQIDLDRVNKDNKWMRAFWKHGLENNDKTIQLMHDVLSWRKSFGANQLLTPGKLPFPEELFTIGAMYFRNKDKNGLPILNFIVKTHKKDKNPHEQITKMIAYFFEINYKFDRDNSIVLLFDMSDAGYSNTDLEMTKFIVNCLKTYYPGLIEYVVVFDMPFIFNAIWKIVKALLPAKAVDLIKFVDKKSILEYFTEDKIFVRMGGKDNYQYSYAQNIFSIDNTSQQQLA